MTLTGVFAASQHSENDLFERILGPASKLTLPVGFSGQPERRGAWLARIGGAPENLEPLRREVGDREDPDALFARLCLELGFVRATERVEGDLPCAAFDGAKLWIRRGRVGREPLVWAELPGGVAFSTRPRALAAALGLRLRDGSIFEERGAFLPPETPWQGLRSLAPGEGLCASTAGVRMLPAEPHNTPAGRDGNPKIWAKALANAVSLATARVGPGASLSRSDGVASGVLARVARSLAASFTVSLEDRAIPEPDPRGLAALSLCLDAPLSDPTLLIDAAVARAVGGGVLLSGRGAAEVLGATVPPAPRARVRALLRGPDARAAEAMDLARRAMPEYTLSPLLRIAEAQGSRLETPYATALVLGVAAMIPAEHMRGRRLLNQAFFSILPENLRTRGHTPPAVPLTDWLRILGEEPGSDPARAWRRVAWREWRAGLEGC